jgi:hypothetical protein
MLPFFYYLLKVTICSAVMYCYYLLALRNKRFHQYNRFYLLSSVALSFIIPLAKIELWKETIQPSPVTTVITFVNEADVYVAKNSFRLCQRDNLFFIAIAIVSMVFLVTLFVSLRKIFVLIRKYPKKLWEGICFVFTNSPGTPFSFFKYIFWNTEIDIESEAGRHILKHELAHVKEKHTLDKIFLSVAFIIGWCNPFLWLIKRELNIIHEFIADQKAISDGDAHSFALMLLNGTYRQQSLTLTNSFFHSPIKRRLLMLTSSNNPRFTYIRRLAVLPLLSVVVLFFAFKLKDEKAINALSALRRIDKMTIQHNEVRNPYLVEKDTGKRKDAAMISSDKKEGFVILKADTFKVNASTSTAEGNVRVTMGGGNNDFKKAYLVVDGKHVTWQELEADKLLPERIERIDVLKGKVATDKYGDNGKEGVVEITTLSSSQTSEQKQYVHEMQNFSKQQQEFAKEQQSINKQQQGYTKEQQNYSKEQEKYLQQQAKNGTTAAKEVTSQPDELPQFPGGLEEWRRYIFRNTDFKALDEHPAPEGKYTVVVDFVISKDGSISNVVARTKTGYGTEEEAIRIISEGRRWQPGKKDGELVDTHIKQTMSYTVIGKRWGIVEVNSIILGSVEMMYQKS